jgi:hypothetical protein
MLPSQPKHRFDRIQSGTALQALNCLMSPSMSQSDCELPDDFGVSSGRSTQFAVAQARLSWVTGRCPLKTFTIHEAAIRGNLLKHEVAVRG